MKRARQIPEWDVYDREIAEFAARVSGDGGALAACVDELAGSNGDVGGEGAAGVGEVEMEGEAEEVKGRLEDEL